MQDMFAAQHSSLTKAEKALGRAADAPAGRRSFLRRGLAAAAAAVGWHASTGTAKAGGDPPPVGIGEQFELLQEHENAHVKFLVGALGDAARPRPTFRNLARPNLADFVQVSQALENTGVGAYLGAAPVIFSRNVLADAGSIALIEARHAGFLNVYRSRPSTENVFGDEQDFERPLTIDEVVAGAAPFIKDLNGGPPLTFSLEPSAKNDIAILNFALALEYLEAEFYNINVPEFFGA